VDIADFALVRDGAAIDLGGLVVEQVAADACTLDLATVTAVEGTYELKVKAQGSGITDAAGNELATDVSVIWVLDATSPEGSIAAVLSPRNQPVGEVVITFSEAVRGADLSDLRLVRGGVPVETAGLEWVVISPLEVRVDLTSVSAEQGAYELRLVAAESGITDVAGNALLEDVYVAWIMDTTPPSATFAPVVTPRTLPVDAVSLTVSEEVQGVNLEDFVLLRDGVPVDMSFALLESMGARDYVLDLSAVTAEDGAYELTLQAAGSLIVDAAGNALAGDARVVWVTTDEDADAVPPVVVQILRADPDPVTVDQARFRVIFSEAVTGVDAADFLTDTNGNVTGAITAIVAEADGQYLVTVGNLRGVGKLGLQLVDDDSIVDLAGNPLGGEGSGNGDFLDGEIYKVKLNWGWQKRRYCLQDWLRAWLQAILKQLRQQLKSKRYQRALQGFWDLLDLDDLESGQAKKETQGKGNKEKNQKGKKDEKGKKGK